ncbi:DNA repair protein rad52 [Rhodotorula kratochvilovae]
MSNWLGDDPPTAWLNPHARTLYREPTHAAPVPGFNPADQVPLSGRVHTPNSITGMSDRTAERTEKLQKLLQKTLGPEHVASRPGGGGTKLSYLEGWRAINLANEIFGYNGWYTDIKYLEADFIDFNEESQRWSIGVTAIVRVRLQDGASHEDVGYGKLENTKSKADGLDKCKKEAVTDALKRALRHFGKLLGNCLYDKSYLEGLSKMKAPKAKFDFDGIYKPERDNLPPIASTSGATASTSMPPPPPPAHQMKKEPAKPPPSMPPHLAAQVHRASTLAPRAGPTAATPARAPGGQPAPRRAATIATPTTMPDPRDRAGAQTEFPLNSDDESMFAGMDLSAAVGGVGESGTGQVYFEGDSGFGEMDGLADASFAAVKPAPPAPAPQPQPQRPSPPAGPGGGGADRLQAAKAAAQARLAEANRRKAEAQRRVSAGAVPEAAGPVLGTGTASAAELLKQGGARPPPLRPPQAPPSRSNSLTGLAPAGAAAKPPARVAGALPALSVGAGVVRAAGGAAGGVGGLVGVSPERTRSVGGAGAGIEVPPQGGYDPSPPLPPNAGAGAAHAHPRTSHSPRAPLGELAIDGTTGAVKRQRGPSG